MTASFDLEIRWMEANKIVNSIKVKLNQFSKFMDRRSCSRSKLGIFFSHTVGKLSRCGQEISNDYELKWLKNVKSSNKIVQKLDLEFPKIFLEILVN